MTGWFLLFIACMVLGAELFVALEKGAYGILALGEIWYRIDGDGLNLVQASIQRHLHPLLWEPVITSVLVLPGWLLPGAGGGLLIYSANRPRRRKIFTAR
ncbi:MAG: hypothetical protein ACE5EM_06580 [Sphingomonadales bacterium]